MKRLIASLILPSVFFLTSCSPQTQEYLNKPAAISSSPATQRESELVKKVEIDLELDTIPERCELYISHLIGKRAVPGKLLGRAPQKTRISFTRQGYSFFPESYGIIAVGPNQEKFVTIFYPAGYEDETKTFTPYFPPDIARETFIGRREIKFPIRKTIRIQLNPFEDRTLTSIQNPKVL